MSPQHPDYYPPYSTPERIADASMHAIGIFGALIGALLLYNSTTHDTAFGDKAAILVYSFAMIIAFCASAAYHFTPWDDMRPIFRKLDHASIFLKIAGTYTPLVVLIGSGFSYFVLGVVWALAIFGVIWKVFFWSTPDWKSTLLYLSLGWISIALAWPLIQAAPLSSVILIAIGGLTYTFGVIFYRWDSLRYSVAIWHAFVVVASGCLYSAIFIGRQAQSLL